MNQIAVTNESRDKREGEGAYILLQILLLIIRVQTKVPVIIFM
jgi:hypothetical protein